MLEDQSLRSLETIIEEHLSKRAPDKPQPPKIRWKWRWVALMGVLLTLGTFCYLESQIHKLERKHKRINPVLKMFKHGKGEKAPMLGGIAVPLQLRNIPFAETDGIVLATKTIDIRNVYAPYNGCLFKAENHWKENGGFLDRDI